MLALKQQSFGGLLPSGQLDQSEEELRPRQQQPRTIRLLLAQHRVETVEQKFQRLADEWHRETDHLSVTAQATAHRAYRDIVDMGEKTVPHILHELQTTGGAWFQALREITGQDAAAGIQDYDAAVREWERWASSRSLTIHR